MFFDNASTTKVDDEIIKLLPSVNDEFYYNPGGLYKAGRNSRMFLEECRKNILNLLNGSGDLIFTGSATESNNLALWGVLKKNTKKILVSSGEHPSVYNVALEMKNRGYNVDFLKLSKNGSVDFDDFKSKMTEDVDIVSVMLVNNETGAINDIAALCQYAKDINPNVLFHCDAVQGVGKIPVDIDELGVDMLTMSAHKIHGCKGVGALYIKKGIKLKPIVYGGGQESGLRSGTENILGIYTLAKAVENSVNNLDYNFQYVKSLRLKFLEGILSSGLSYTIHSPEANSPYIVSISFLGCRAETILNMMSDRNICVGNGSACSSKKSGNRILESMGVPNSEIESNLRISFSKYNTSEEVVELVANLKEVVLEYLNKVR